MTVYGETNKVSQGCLYVTKLLNWHILTLIPLLTSASFIWIVDIHNCNSVFLLFESITNLLYTVIKEMILELCYYVFWNVDKFQEKIT